VPFPRDNDMAVLYAHLHEPPPKLSERRPGLPEGLDAVVAKAMDKSPDRRFATCADLIAAARAVVDAAGPLAESSAAGRRPSTIARRIPVEGDAPSMPTATGRAVPSSAYSLSAVRGQDGGRAIVLLAGVDAGSRALVRVALGERCEVLEADALDDVLALARERRPDVVLVHAASHGAPPAEVASALRGDAVTRDARIVLLGAGRDTGRRQMTSMGVDDTLATPFSPLQLQVKLRRMLGSGRVA
jgi:serine/threonine-protein kinase